MKLKYQIVLFVLTPLVVMLVAVCIISSLTVKKRMKASVKAGMYAAAEATREAVTEGLSGDFHVDANGDLWNGEDLNITQTTDIVDKVKKASKMEVTIFFGDTRYATSVKNAQGQRALGTQASKKVTDIVLGNNEEFFAENVDVVGTKFFAVYLPLYGKDTMEPIGMVFIGRNQEAFENDINRIVNNIVYIAIAVMIISTIIILLLVSKLTKNISHSKELLEAVSKGDLQISVDTKLIKRKDEIGSIGRAVKDLKDELVVVISQIKDKSGKLDESADTLEAKGQETASTVEQVEKAVSEIAEGATSQANETQQATENVIVMGNMIEETKEEVVRLLEIADSMKQSSQQATQTLAELDEINRLAKQSIDVIYEQTNTTNESAQKIREATSLITSIAEETNLLSLNASIEAARAGDQGKGFAVVASQIQKLAEQSNDSARRIESIINSLIEDSDKSVETMNEVNEIMVNQSAKVSDTDKSFHLVNDGVIQSINNINSINEHTERLDKARGEVIDTVQSLNAIAEENAASTEETSAAVTQVNSIIAEIAESTTDLKEISRDLQDSVSFFKL